MPENVAAKVLNRSHSITAEVEIPPDGAEGVLLAHGGNVGGYSFFIQNKKLCYVHNYVGAAEYYVESSIEVLPGKSTLRYEFEPTGQPDLRTGKGVSGRAQLYINDKLVGQSEIPVTIPLTVSIGEGLVVGRDAGSPVSSRYQPPFKFAGTLFKVTLDVSGKMIQDTEEEEKAFAKVAIARQ